MEPMQSMSPPPVPGASYKQPSPPLSPSHPRTLPDTGLPPLPLLPSQMSSNGPTSQEGTPVSPTASTSALPLPTLPPVGAAGPATLGASLPPPQMHHFIPDNPDGSDDDEDEDDDSGRPKKKVKKTGGKGAAGSGGAAAAAAGGAEEGAEKGRRKIEIEYIQKKEKRHITFSKRKAGIMKKAYELATLTGTQVLLLVVSETGIVYTFTTAAFQPLVGAAENGAPSEGQRLIQQCLAVDPSDGSDYISPPPDGPLLPLPPKASKRPFETNSAIHGGQIALRTRTHRPSTRTKGRPAAIHTGSPDQHPSVLQHPLDQSPMQLPPSPHRVHPLQQAHHSPGMRDYPSPGLPSGNRPGDGQMQSAQEYAEMMQRSQMSNGGGYPPQQHQGHPYPQNPGDYGMHPHQQMMHHPHSPVDRYQRPTSQSPHIQHQQVDNGLGGPQGGYDDSNLLPLPQQGHPQQGAYLQQQQQQQPMYEDDPNYIQRR